MPMWADTLPAAGQQHSFRALLLRRRNRMPHDAIRQRRHKKAPQAAEQQAHSTSAHHAEK